MRKTLLLIFIFSSLFIKLYTQSLFERSISPGEENLVNPLEFNGNIRSAMYLASEPETELIYLQSIYSQFTLSANATLDQYGTAYAELRVRNGLEYKQKFNAAELREAYVKVFLGPLSFKIGKQILNWGGTSFINPTDQFSPSDPTFRSPIISDSRIGTWSLLSRISIANSSSLDIVWIPLYEPSVLITSPFNFPESIGFAADKLTPVDLNKGSFALKYDLRTSLLDFDISYFNGYRNTPSISLDSIEINFSDYSIDKLSLIKTPYRIQATSLNLAIPLGGAIVRSEASWMDLLSQEEDVISPFSELSYAAELEKSGQNATFIIGYYGKYIIDFVKKNSPDLSITEPAVNLRTLWPYETIPSYTDISQVITSQISAFNGLMNYQLEEFYHALYASAKLFLFQERLELTIPLMYNFTAEEFTFLPSIKLKISDGVLFQIGSYGLYGKNASLYDQIGPYLNAGYGLMEIKF